MTAQESGSAKESTRDQSIENNERALKEERHRAVTEGHELLIALLSSLEDDEVAARHFTQLEEFVKDGSTALLRSEAIRLLLPVVCQRLPRPPAHEAELLILRAIEWVEHFVRNRSNSFLEEMELQPEKIKLQVNLIPGMLDYEVLHTERNRFDNYFVRLRSSIWNSDRVDVQSKNPQTHWLARHDPLEGELPSSTLGRGELVERAGYGWNLIQKLAAHRPTDAQTSFPETYRIEGHSVASTESPAYQRSLELIPAYGELASMLDVGLMQLYGAAYDGKITLALTAQKNQRELQKEKSVALEQQELEAVKALATEYGGQSPARKAEIEELATRFWLSGTNRATRDIEQAKSPEGVLPVTLHRFVARLDFFALGALAHWITVKSSRLSPEQNKAVAFKLISDVLSELDVDGETARYGLMALDDRLAVWPILATERVMVGRRELPLQNYIREKLVKGLGWSQSGVFEQELSHNPAILDLVSGFPEAVIHAYLVKPAEFPAGFVRKILQADSARSRDGYLELLERLLLVPNQILRVQARQLVNRIVRDQTLIAGAVEDVHFLNQIEQVTELLPDDDANQIMVQLFAAVAPFLKGQQINRREQAWRLRLHLVARGHLAEDSRLETLFPRNLEIPANQQTTDTQEEIAHRQFAEWEARFPVFGTQGMLKQYMDFFHLEKLENPDLPDEWLHLCQERVELLSLELQSLNLQESQAGVGQFGVEAATLTKMLSVTSFNWTLDGDGLTVIFHDSQGKDFQVATASISEPFQPISGRISFFEPYLRAAVLQVIYRQLSNDERYDAVSDLESFHLASLSRATAETQASEKANSAPTILTEATSSIAPSDEQIDQVPELSFDDIIQKFVTAGEARTVAESTTEAWRDRVLTKPKEIYEFFDQKVELPNLTDADIKKLEDIRANMLVNLGSTQHAVALPSDGLTVHIVGGTWLGRRNWDEMTGVNRVELFPAQSGSTALAVVRIHYADRLRLDTELERDGLLKLANGLDWTQRTALEAMVLRCLEQETTKPITLPETPPSPSAKPQGVVTKVPGAPHLTRQAILREPTLEELSHRTGGHGRPRNLGELEAAEYYTVPARRVWTGIKRGPDGRWMSRNTGPGKSEQAVRLGIELITATRIDPEDPNRRFTIYSTIRSEHDRPVVRKKEKRLTDTE